MKYASGEISEGEYDHVRNGISHTVWGNGDKYEGMYKDDKRHGKGIFTSGITGDSYDGDWQDNKKYGFGKVITKQGEVKYEGYWVDDEIDDSIYSAVTRNLPTVPEVSLPSCTIN